MVDPIHNVQNKQYDPARKTAVGDLNSKDKGSGARDNAGKARVDLLTFLDVATLIGTCSPMGRAMTWLGHFQETHDHKCLDSLIGALYPSDREQAIFDASAVFEFGAKKYKAWNWYKGMPWSVPVGCIGRHLLSLSRGEQMDPDSGLPHRGHVVCNVFMLLAYCRMYTEGNDLPPRLPDIAPLQFGGAIISRAEWLGGIDADVVDAELRRVTGVQLREADTANNPGLLKRETRTCGFVIQSLMDSDNRFCRLIKGHVGECS